MFRKHFALLGYKGDHSHDYTNDGRFAVVAQRSYRVGSGYTAYNVFSEEHDSHIYIGVPSNGNWIPLPTNAWDLATNNTPWTWYYGGDWRVFE